MHRGFEDRTFGPFGFPRSLSLRCMSTIPSMPSSFRTTHSKAFLLAVLSASLFALSWPGIGQFWVLILFAFLPLFWLHDWRLDGSLTNTSFIWFTALAFFLWNTSSVYFLFNIEESVGIKLLSLLTPVVINTIWMTAVMVGFSKMVQKSKLLIGLPFLICAWLAVEWGQHHWALAFPWLTLGNVMAPHPALIQWYSITGVAGGSLVVLLMNYSVFSIVSGSRKALWKWGFVMVCLCSLFVWSLVGSETGELRNTEKKRFTVVQPGLENETEKLNPALAQDNLSRSLQLLDFRTSPGTVVLPETFVFEPGRISGPPGNLQFTGLWMHDMNQSMVVRELRDFAIKPGVDGVVTGAYVSRFYREFDLAPAFAYPINDLGAAFVNYNSALLLDSASTQLRHKNMLVAGVERIPFAETLPVMNKFALDLGGIAGTLGEPEEPAAAELAGTSLGVQICYDSAFGWLANEMVRDGAQILVVITNDSWWGNTPGHLQLLSFTQLRAIETGRSVVRSANNGISAFISPKGEIVEQLPWNEKGAITSDVAKQSHLTFYSQWGDYIYLMATLCLPLIFMSSFFLRMKSR